MKDTKSAIKDNQGSLHGGDSSLSLKKILAKAQGKWLPVPVLGEAGEQVGGRAMKSPVYSRLRRWSLV